ncbi:MAG: hypothetical protein ABJB40_10070, partial [Acidobacteriota bacterium]
VDGTPSIGCTIKELDRAKFDNVKEGDTVRLKGTLKMEEKFVGLSPCQLERVGVYSISDN